MLTQDLGPLALFVSLSLTTGLQAVKADDGPVSDVIVLGHCPVEYERSAMLGAAQPGVLQDSLVQLGDRVTANQVLGRLRDAELRAELELKLAIVENDVEVRTSEAKHAEVLGRLKAADTLRQRNFMSVESYNVLQLEARTTALEIEGAKERRRLAAIQAKQMRELVHAREFVAPFDGLVVEIYKASGESVSLNDPVFRVVDPDRLRVTGHIDVADAWRVRPGLTVRFIPEIGGADLAIENEAFSGRVVFVDTGIDSTSQTCRILVSVENREGILRAGIEGRLEIDSSTTAAATAPKETAPRRTVATRPVAPSQAAPAARVVPPGS